MGATDKLDRNMIIKLAITFGVPVLLMLIPTGEVFTAQMRTAIALTAWLLIWAAFDLSSLLIPSILWSAALIFTKTVEASSIFGTYMSMTLISICKAAIFTCKELWTPRF